MDEVACSGLDSGMQSIVDRLHSGIIGMRYEYNFEVHQRISYTVNRYSSALGTFNPDF